MDVFVLPAEREAFVDVLTECGFGDYYEQAPYDRLWIYRGMRDGVIVEVIWQMANYLACVDEQWLTRGRWLELDGVRVRLLPVEELIWTKLYILPRERCDWTDLLIILYAQGATLDWSHLLWRVDADAPLLAGLLSVFAWLCPTQARRLPAWLWERIGLKAPPIGPDCRTDRERVRLLDSRDWFGP